VSKEDLKVGIASVGQMGRASGLMEAALLAAEYRQWELSAELRRRADLARAAASPSEVKKP
jgi:hypothetical protein